MTGKPPDERPPRTPAAPAKRPTTQGTPTTHSTGRTSRITVRTRWSEQDHLFRVCLEVPALHVRVMLTHAEAFNHAQAVIAAGHRAHFDALMLRQFAGKFHVPVATVSNVVREARKHRPPLADVNTDPLQFDSGVDGKSGRGYVAVAVGVERIARWNVSEADAYARTVIAMTERADLDTAAFHTLTTWGAEEQRVRAALSELHAPHEF